MGCACARLPRDDRTNVHTMTVLYLRVQMGKYALSRTQFMSKPKWFTLNAEQRGNTLRWHPSNGWFLDHGSESTGGGLRCLNGDAFGPLPMRSARIATRSFRLLRGALLMIFALDTPVSPALLARFSCLNFGSEEGGCVVRLTQDCTQGGRPSSGAAEL